MAQTIKLKRSSTGGAVPSTSSLSLGEVAINTYDGKMYIKKNDGSDAIVEIGAGNGEAVWNSYDYTATSSQTSFSGSDNNSQTLSYVPDFLQVFLNGILLDPAVDYAATTGNSIVLTVGATTNDLIQIETFTQIIGTGDILVDTFPVSSTQTAFTLSQDPINKSNISVYVEGVYQESSTYSLSGTTLTLSESPANGTTVEVVIGTRNVTLDGIVDLTISGTLHAGALDLGDANIINVNEISLDTIKGDADANTNITFAGNDVTTFTQGGTERLRLNTTGAEVTGNIVVSGNVDGRDVAADGVTADAALPRTGGAMGGAITTNSTFDGRDVSVDGTKLDGIESGATADQTDVEIRAAVESASDSNVFTNADHSKLDGIEALADVTDATNVTSAGALMDSEVTNLAQVKAFDSSDYATAAQGTIANAALPKAGGTMTGNIVSSASVTANAFLIPSIANIYTSSNNLYIKTETNGTGIVYESRTGYHTFRNGTDNQIQIQPTAIQFYKNATFAGTISSGAITASGAFLKTGTNGNYTIAANGNDFYYGRNGTNYHIANTANGAFQFLTGSSSAAGLSISSSQNVNIPNGGLMVGATTAPTETLTLDKSSGNVFQRFDKSGAIKGLIGVADSSAQGSSTAVQGDMILRGQTNLLLDTAGTTRLTINSSGNATFSGSVTSPQLKIEGTEPLLFFNDTTTGHDDWKMYADWDQFQIQQYVNDTTWTSRLVFAASGNATFSGSVTSTGLTSSNSITMNAGNLSLNSTSDGNQAFRYYRADGTLVGQIYPYNNRYNVQTYNNQGIRLKSHGSGQIELEGNVVINEDSADVNFRVESNGNANMLFVDGGNNTVTVGSSISNAGAPFLVDYNNTSKFMMGGVQGGISNNIYYNGSAWQSVNNSVGGGILQISTDGSFAFRRGTASSTPSLSYSVYIDPNGNVGIGTTSPSKPLTVSGADAEFLINRTGGYADTITMGMPSGVPTIVGGTDLAFGGTGAWTEHMRIKADGKVGIGTTGPTALLHVKKDVDSFIMKVENDGNSAGTSGASYADASDGLWVDTRWNTATNTPFKVTSNSGNTPMMIIKGNGNVGIGTSSPTHKLQVLSTDNKGFYLERNTGNEPANLNEFSAYYSLSIKNRASGSFLNFGGSSSFSSMQATDGAGSATAKIISLNPYGGNVGIGTTSPSSLLNVHSSTAPKITISNGGGTSPNPELEFLRQSGVAARIVYEVANKDLVIKNDSTLGNIQFKQGSVTQVEIEGSTGTVDITNDVLANNAKLKAIAASNTDTAVDVFVYDTRKDSDGGAWRKRTQHTSWYNEALNTSTRGARKEFPSVAVIVADNSSDKITIYDGDDPDMPMWMVFQVANGKMLGEGNVTAIAALNGIISVACGGTGYDFYTANIIEDTGYQWFTAEYKRFYSNVATRNVVANASDVNASFILLAAIGLISRKCNDVAMTVLPNAPINADTGLPVPTIAVATNGGTSVITDSGAVYDITGFSPVENVNFYGDKLAINTPVSSTSYINIGPSSVSADISSGAWHEVEINSTNSNDFKILTNSANHQVFDDTYYSAGLNGLVSVKPDYTAPETSLHAFTASDYNTGYQVGDIKLATLSDTDTTNANPSELISNGDFSNGTTGWTAQLGANLSVSSGQLTVVSTGANSLAYQYFTADLTKSYTLKVTVVSGSGALLTGGYNSGTLSAGTYTLNMSAGRTNNKLDITPPTNGTMVVDNISIKLAEQDRSVNGNGLQVFGTVTKTAVATGADLVGYSGFSSSNYMLHSVSTNYGSPAVVSFMGWQKVSDISNYQYMISLIDGTSGAMFGMSVNSSSVSDAGKPYFYDGTNSSLLATTRVDDGQWHFMVGVFDGTSKKLYIDGKLNASSTVTALAMTNVTATNVGFYSPTITGTKQYFHLGSIALIRTSATAPTAEQIAKIYNDEKHLFATNAKATLYGTSNAVTALAYDDDTELLHVGTSAGRSEFQGLNRVNNTTDAVGTAISASNGFIVEE